MPYVTKIYRELRTWVEVLNSDALLGMLDRGDIEFAVCGDRQIPSAWAEITPLEPTHNALLVRRGHSISNRPEPMSDVWALRGCQVIVVATSPSKVRRKSRCRRSAVIRGLLAINDAVGLGPSGEGRSSTICAMYKLPQAVDGLAKLIKLQAL
jgi:hypothetical protein